MTADPICFATKCGKETQSLTPTSVKGLKCLGACKGAQACASQCFNRYSSPELEDWLNCALERESCLPLPPSAQGSAPVAELPPGSKIDWRDMEGQWYKVLGKVIFNRQLSINITTRSLTLYSSSLFLAPLKI